MEIFWWKLIAFGVGSTLFLVAIVVILVKILFRTCNNCRFFSSYVCIKKLETLKEDQAPFCKNYRRKE